MPAMFNEPFQRLPNMFDGTLTDPSNMFDNLPVNSQPSRPSMAAQGGERIIPIKLVNAQSDLNQVRERKREREILIRLLILD